MNSSGGNISIALMCKMEPLTSEVIAYKFGFPLLSCLGIVGNIFNLLILCHRSWSRISRLERFSHRCFIALAVSDSLFCVTCLPLVVTTDQSRFVQKNRYSFVLLHRACGSLLMNSFILCSTFLTVSISVVRYLSVKFPFEARARVGATLTKYVIALSFVLAFVCNVPRAFVQRIEPIDATDGRRRYEVMPQEPDWEPGYDIAYFVITIVLPLLILTFCTIFLLVHLQRYQTPTLQAAKHVVTSHGSSGCDRKIAVSRTKTIILIAIVIQYVVCVIPTETMQFYEKILLTDDVPPCQRQDTVRAVQAVVNLMELFNFASNFILYLALNSNYRLATHNLLVDIRDRVTRSSTSSTQHPICTGDTPAESRKFSVNSPNLSTCKLTELQCLNGAAQMGHLLNVHSNGPLSPRLVTP